MNGLASKRDETYVRFRNYINRGKYTESLSPSILNIKAPDGRDYKALWLESPYGAYAVIKTKLPVDQRRIYQKLYKKTDIKLKDAYSVVFSPYPDFLETVLTQNPNDSDYPKNADIQSYVDVHAAYLEKDLVYQSGGVTGSEHLLDMSWVHQVVQEHMVQNEQRLKTHGVLLRTDENMYRSGSTIIWFQCRPDNPHQYDCFYYGNPAQGEDMLFSSDDIADSTVMYGLLRTGSKKINQEPIESHQRHDFARQSFLSISQKIMRNSEPYDLYKPEKGIMAKTGHITQREVLRLKQKMFHDVSTIDTHALSITLVGTIAITAVMMAYKLAAAVVIRASEVLVRGVNSLFKAASKYVVPPKTGTYRYLNDYAHLMGGLDSEAKSLVTKATKGRPIDPYFAKRSELVPVEMLGALYPDAVPYTHEGENNRVEKLLLDTTRYPCGTVISEETVSSRRFLKVEQPDGITIYRDVEQQLALAMKASEPLIGAYLDKSVKQRFDCLQADESVLGVRYIRGQGLSSKGFKSGDNALDDAFYPNENITQESITRNVADIDECGKHQDITVENILLRNYKEPMLKGMLKKISLKAFGKAINKTDTPDVNASVTKPKPYQIKDHMTERRQAHLRKMSLMMR